MAESLKQLGIIFHVGIYSFFGFDDVTSARRRKNGGNGAEWYLERLQERSYRPISGSERTQAYHKKYGVEFDYFRAPFFISRESICKWLDLCVKCKASYVLITSKHHDGFCLWPTNTTDKKSSNDVILIFKEEALKRGLIFGIYYSWYEFLNPMTIDFFNNICIPQLRELLTYNPSMIWFDGDWVCKTKYVISKIAEIIIYLKSLNIVINDRICNENKSLASFLVGPDRSFYGGLHYCTSPWQNISTIGLSWGYNRDQEAKDYKSGQQLYELLTNVTNMGGNLLLNIGPKHDGTLDQREEDSLNELARLLGN
jgi:alpha-L-fucosidase